MSKNIIICYDGTSNEYGEYNTNVVKTFEAILRNKDQVAFYDPGVGTFSPFGIKTGKWLGKALGNGFGVGLQKNIEDGYEYLMNRFNEGDKVYIFGFSRGAFTARSLAGMIHRFGVLQKGSKNLIPYVSKMYNKREFTVAESFKKTFSHECKPHFIGVWDTVGSLGYFHGKKFHDQKLNPDIKYGYQAMAIDEERKKFPISLWDMDNIAAGQTIEQVWFSGVHCDVGGSYPETGLSDIALAWLIDKAVECDLIVKKDWDKKLKQNPKTKIHKSRKGFWKVWRPVTRKIIEPAMIHQSVYDKMDFDPNYQSAIPDGSTKVSNPSYKPLV